MRNEWTITIPVLDLRQQVQQRRLYRSHRVQFWQDQKDLKLADLKSTGIEVSEGFDQFGKEALTYSNSAGGHFSVTLDPTLQRAIGEAHKKIKEHEAMLLEYNKWSDFLEHDTGSVTLDFSDYVFFFRD
jgi:hypothetical protein